jgi:hypothetical protein
MPPHLVQRFEPLHSALKPSAKSWVDQQARIEAQRPHPDLNALRAAIRQRFAGSLTPASSRGQGKSAKSDDGGDIMAICFVVLMQASDSAQNDVKEIMQGVQVINKQKAALRQMMDQANSDVAASKASQRSQICTTPFCNSLASSFAAINASSAKLPHPVHLQAPARITYAQLQTLVSQMESALNSIGDDAQLANVDLQNILQRQQQELQMLSNIEKSLNDTAMSIISNLK